MCVQTHAPSIRTYPLYVHPRIPYLYIHARIPSIYARKHNLCLLTHTYPLCVHAEVPSTRTYPLKRGSRPGASRVDALAHHSPRTHHTRSTFENVSKECEVPRLPRTRGLLAVELEAAVLAVRREVLLLLRQRGSALAVPAREVPSPRESDHRQSQFRYSLLLYSQ